MGLIKQGAVLGETEEVTNSAKCSPPAVAYQLMQMPCALLLVQSVRRPNTFLSCGERRQRESVGVVVCFFFVLLAYSIVCTLVLPRVDWDRLYRSVPWYLEPKTRLYTPLIHTCD